MAVEKAELTSSNLKSVTYDSDRRILTIEFISGGEFEYLNVPPFTFTGLVNAASAGKYFHAHIKRQYTGRKV